MFTSTLSRTALVVLGLAAAGAASAQTKTWTFSDTVNPGLCGQTTAGTGLAANTGGAGAAGATNIGNVWSCADQGTSGPPYNLTLAGWSAAGATGGGAMATATITPQGASGVGVGNRGEGGQLANSGNFDHSMDSANGNGIDALLLTFSSAEVLRTVSLGWVGTDSDFQVLRYTGTGTISPDGRTAATMVGVGGGWQLVSTISGTGVGSYDVNTGGLSSSYWLITAFNSNFGGSTGDTTADAIKVLGVTSRPNGVSEPGSLALAGMALLGVFAARRKVGAQS